MLSGVIKNAVVLAAVAGMVRRICVPVGDCAADAGFALTTFPPTTTKSGPVGRMQAALTAAFKAEQERKEFQEC